MNEDERNYSHPAYDVALSVPGLSVAVSSLDALLSWGSRNSLWIFPMATSCCGIELMAAAAARVDLDRMGTIVRASPRQADVMVVAGTITVKMAPRVRRLWDQMPEPKWCVAMGSCAISGDFYRDIYSVVPGIDTVIPVDVYVPGCPPNPESLMEGLLRLQDKIAKERKGGRQPAEARPPGKVILPVLGRLDDPERDPAITEEQTAGTRAPGDLAGEVKVTPQLPGPARAIPADYATILRDRFGLEADPALAPLLPADRHIELASALRDAGYRLFTFVVASHWPAPPPPQTAKEGEAARSEEFELAYGLRKPEPGAPLAMWRLRIQAGEEVDSLAMLYAGADWQEREQFDLVGVRFRGHPDLRRIMLPQAWEGHPLRRDYPIETPHRPWR